MSVPKQTPDPSLDTDVHCAGFRPRTGPLVSLLRQAALN